MSRSLTIAGRTIDDDSDAFCVAELGHNHGGSLDTARAMIRAAATAGADAVKLQKRSNRELYTPEFYNQPYTSENAFGPTYGEHREALEFDWLQYALLMEHACDVGVTLFATGFDKRSVDDLASFGEDNVPCFKIASSDVVNLPFLRYVAEFQKPMLVSTGGACQQDVDRAVNAIYPINPQLALLHCTAIYPAPAETLNLRIITTYRERYPDFVIGHSSHFAHPYDSLVAFALGARIFERHFTLDRTSKGSDHAFSLEPDGFAGMVSHLRAARLMMGSPEKVFLPGEQEMVTKMRRSTRWYQELFEGE